MTIKACFCCLSYELLVVWTSELNFLLRGQVWFRRDMEIEDLKIRCKVLRIQVTIVVCNFLKFKLQRQDVHSNHSSKNFKVQTRFKSCLIFLQRIHHSYDIKKYHSNYIFLWTIYKRDYNVKYELQLFCLQKTK